MAFGRLLDLSLQKVRSPSIPQLPQQRALYSYLSPYHAKLVGESFLGRKRPVYECTDMQEEFEEYAEKAKTLPESTTNESKLILYRLYKQANVGPVKANPFH